MLPEGWTETTVFDACERVSVGIVVNPSSYYVNHEAGIRAFRSSNVRENQVNDENWVFISKDGNIKNKKSILKGGDVLVVRTGFAGTACVLPEHYAGSNCIDILFARPKADVLLPEYLCQLTNSELGRRQVLSGQSGLAQKHLNVSSYEKMMFGLPPVEEQRNTVAILCCWDEAIVFVEQILANCKRQKSALIGHLLRRHQQKKIFAKWSFFDLDAIFERVVRKNSEGNVNVLTISGEHGLISQRDYFNKSVASENLSGYTLIRKGEFAYNKSYSNGYPMGAIKPLQRYEAGVVSSLYICFRIRDDVEADLDFFRHYFEAGLLNEALMGVAQEGARNHGLLNVGVGDFFKLRLQVPAIKEQRRIAAILNAADAEIDLIAKQLAALRNEKQALMQQLLTGKRRVTLSAAAAKTSPTKAKSTKPKAVKDRRK